MMTGWQQTLDAQAAFTGTLIELVKAKRFDELNQSLSTCSEAYREAFQIWMKHNLKACDMPPQPGDDKPVGPGSKITWGQLFGRVNPARCKECGHRMADHVDGSVCPER